MHIMFLDIDELLVNEMIDDIIDSRKHFYSHGKN